jgi:hypothetical protein
MLFFLAGSPGRFAEQCSALVARLVTSVLGPADLVRGDTPEEVIRSLLLSNRPYSVVTSHCPVGRIGRTLRATGRPFVVALENPQAAIFDLVVRHGVEFATATRITASSCASVMRLCEAAGALVLNAGNRSDDWATLGTAIAKHLRFDLDRNEVSNIIKTCENLDVISSSDSVNVWWEGLAEVERGIAAGALAPYLDPREGSAPAIITWARELFFVGDQPQQRATGDIDITGRARCLLRGPQILLPPATWSLSVSLDISGDAAEHSFVLEVTAGAVSSRTVIRPAAAGRVEANLSLVLVELPDQPIELILSTERPAFGGHVTLLGVIASPQHPDAAPDRL